MSANIKPHLQTQKLQTNYDKIFYDTLFASLGHQCEVKMQNNDVGEGIFYTLHPQNYGIVLNKYSESQDQKKNSNIQKIIEKDDYVHVLIKNIENPPYQKEGGAQKVTSKIKTDVELSKKQENSKRNFEAFDMGDEELGGIEDGDYKDYKAEGKFDQFSVNSKKFGLDIEFNEEKYTSNLDMGQVSEELIKKAEQAEKELQNEGKNKNLNRHILEDRGQLELKEDEDEEQQYSAVIGSGRYQNNNQAVPEKVINYSKQPPKFTNSKKNQQKIETINTVDQEVNQNDKKEKVEEENNQSINQENQQQQSQQQQQQQKTEIQKSETEISQNDSINSSQNQKKKKKLVLSKEQRYDPNQQSSINSSLLSISNSVNNSQTFTQPQVIGDQGFQIQNQSEIINNFQQNTVNNYVGNQQQEWNSGEQFNTSWQDNSSILEEDKNNNQQQQLKLSKPKKERKKLNNPNAPVFTINDFQEGSKNQNDSLNLNFQNNNQQNQQSDQNNQNQQQPLKQDPEYYNNNSQNYKSNNKK